MENEKKTRSELKRLTKLLPLNVNLLHYIILMGTIKNFYLDSLRQYLLNYKADYEKIFFLTLVILLIINSYQPLNRRQLTKILKPAYSSTSIGHCYGALRRASLIIIDNKRNIRITSEGKKWTKQFYKKYAENLLFSADYLDNFSIYDFV